MKLRTIAFTGVLLAATAGITAYAAGCGGSVEQTPQTSANAASKAPVATQSHGMVKVFGDALGDVALRPDQRGQVEKLAEEAEARHQPLFERRRDLAMTVADQIEKGTIDRAVMQAKLDELTRDLDKIGVDDRAALVRLHDLLDKDQRNAFVDALEKRFEGHGFQGEGGRPGMAKLKQLADDLKLTDEQRGQIRDIIRDGVREAFKHGGEHGEWHGRRGQRAGKGALEAFREDKLDVEKLGAWGSPEHPGQAKTMADLRAGQILGVAEKILPILTPEQRKIAADKLREAATRGETIFTH
jgi:Spy/CpxP family protein refolding chaperone